jgi:hypothetical protein
MGEDQITVFEIKDQYKNHVWKMIGKYLWNWLVWVDIGGNVLFGGSPCETISARVGRTYQGSVAQQVIDWLFWWQDPKDHDHCADAAEDTPVDREDDAILK